MLGVVSHGVDGRATVPRIDAELGRSIAQTMQALSTPSRVAILGRLREGACSVGELTDTVGMSQSAVSHQLAMLRHLGLVIGERRGRQVIYALHDPHVATLIEQAAFHAEHLRLGAPMPVEREAAS